MNNIKQLRQDDIQKLNIGLSKLKIQYVEETAKLAQSGKKHSKQTGKIKKEIAQIETVINEKLLDQIKERNG